MNGKNGVTSNLACISIMVAIEEKKKLLLMENHFSMNNIENAMVHFHSQNVVNEQDYYFNHVGMDHLMKKFHSQMYDKDMIEHASLSFLNGHIYYIPQSKTLNKEVFEYQLNEVIIKMLKEMEETCDLTFIDTMGSENLTTKVILDEADLVVVNLSQNHMVWKDFFEKYDSLVPKALFLISKYDSNSIYNVVNIMRKYQISKERIAIIPYNVELKDSISEGKLIEFISRNYYCEPGDSNFYFMKELKNASNLIINRLQHIRKEGGCD